MSKNLKNIVERIEKKCDFLIFDTVESFEGFNYREGKDNCYNLPIVQLIENSPEKLEKLESIIDGLINLKKEMLSLDSINSDSGKVSTHYFNVKFGYMYTHKDVINKPFES